MRIRRRKVVVAEKRTAADQDENQKPRPDHDISPRTGHSETIWRNSKGNMQQNTYGSSSAMIPSFTGVETQR
jgi:hypothetical protein